MMAAGSGRSGEREIPTAVLEVQDSLPVSTNLFVSKKWNLGLSKRPIMWKSSTPGGKRNGVLGLERGKTRMNEKKARKILVKVDKNG